MATTAPADAGHRGGEDAGGGDAPTMTPWTFMQLADSALPAGGFAHSAGLEAALQLGRCRDVDDLRGFLEEALWNAGTSALPFVGAAVRAPEQLATLDARCDAALPGSVANRASRAQGHAFLRAVASARPREVGALAARVAADRLAGHLAPVFGAAVACLGADVDGAAHLYLFVAARTAISAGVRLGITGPLEAQRLLADAEAIVDAVVRACASRAPEEAASTSPLLDVLQGHQERLYSRLFQS